MKPPKRDTHEGLGNVEYPLTNDQVIFPNGVPLDTTQDSDFRFSGHWWSWDCRKDPWDKSTKNDWKMYDDHTSVLIERGYMMWLKSGKDE